MKRRPRLLPRHWGRFLRVRVFASTMCSHLLSSTFNGLDLADSVHRPVVISPLIDRFRPVNNEQNFSDRFCFGDRLTSDNDLLNRNILHGIGPMTEHSTSLYFPAAALYIDRSA
jgi:hypothetical protein